MLRAAGVALVCAHSPIALPAAQSRWALLGRASSTLSSAPCVILGSAALASFKSIRENLEIHRTTPSKTAKPARGESWWRSAKLDSSRSTLFSWARRPCSAPQASLQLPRRHKLRPATNGSGGHLKAALEFALVSLRLAWLTRLAASVSGSKLRRDYFSPPLCFFPKFGSA